MRGGTRRVRDASTSDAQNTIPNDSIAMHTIGKSIGVCCLFCLVYVLGCLKATGVYNRYNLFIFFFFPGLVVVHVFQPHLFICFTFNSCTYAYLPNTLCYIDTTIITTKTMRDHHPFLKLTPLVLNACFNTSPHRLAQNLRE